MMYVKMKRKVKDLKGVKRQDVSFKKKYCTPKSRASKMHVP